jgi:hypothetical protein
MYHPCVGAGLTYLFPKPARLKLLNLRRDLIYTVFYIWGNSLCLV